MHLRYRNNLSIHWKINGWIRRDIYIQTRNHSAIKKKGGGKWNLAICNMDEPWGMNLECKSESERQKSYGITHMETNQKKGKNKTKTNSKDRTDWSLPEEKEAGVDEMSEWGQVYGDGWLLHS